jgi:2-methylisocitrate lyase-like PEP mutase family enzyme
MISPIAMARLLRDNDGGRGPTLRELIAGPEMLLAPGCYDALGARLVEEAGFPAVHMTGFGSAASRLGRPDVGLMSLPEMVDNAHRIAEAVDIPVIADADTGYGNPVNVIHTVREYETAGVSAIHIEDQVMPKKCGHMDGKHLIDAAEMAAKIAAAVAAELARVPDHRPHRRARRRRAARRARAGTPLPPGRSRHTLHRGAAVGSRNRSRRPHV